MLYLNSMFLLSGCYYLLENFSILSISQSEAAYGPPASQFLVFVVALRQQLFDLF